MFGVANHFSIGDLLPVRRIALPGAVGQVVVATALGGGLAAWWGWGWGAGIVLGLALSVASTVVLRRALEERDTLTSPSGRVAVGWLVVEDLIMVLALVLLPPFAGSLGDESPAGTGDNLALPEEGRHLILAGGLLSITLNPLLFRAVETVSVRHQTLARRLDGADPRRVRPS